MTRRPFRDGEIVVIRCESCEPEVAMILGKGPRCSDCSNETYRLQTEMSLVVECCSSILHPLN